MTLKFYFLPVLFFSISVLAQTKQDNETNKMMSEMFGLPELVEPSQQYLSAIKLVDNALQKLESGDINAADKAIRESIALYPTMHVFDYVKQLCLLPDIFQANAVMNVLYAKVLSLEGRVIVQELGPYTLKDGKMIKAERKYDKNRALFNFAFKIANLNKEYGSYQQYLTSTKAAVEIILLKNPKASLDIEFDTQYYMKYSMATAQGDFDKGIQMINDVPVDSHHTIEAKNNNLVELYLQKQDYEKAIAINNQFKGSWLEIKSRNSFKINALQGNNEAALQDLKMAFKKEEEKSREIYYYLAIINLNKLEYEKALENLNLSINKKGTGFAAEFEGLAVDKYKVYKLMGDAYKGLSQNDKAKDFYDLSLLFYPEYEPAIIASAKLESVKVTTLSTDKVAPGIKITEPVANRGLEIVAAGQDILVKGIASDPSGLKSVTINGISVYAQVDGNFWGNIPLNDDVNKITVVATDGAGNVAEQVFEIKKNSQETVSEVVVATEREGTNYCLLIGAQNYEDSTIPSLENPIQDAVRLKLILKNNYGFNDSNIVSLFNPKADDVKRQLLELTNTIQPEDNLLIFYAGHGIWVEKEKKGYWLLVDAKRNDPNTWLQNKEVLNLIAKLPSRHTLLITDACFSGGVFKTRSIGKDAPEVIKSINEKISRVAITSGNDTEVPDESVFMKYLIKALSENEEQYLTAQKMFITQIMEAVMTETKTEPRYGTLELAGHVGGDYIFSRK